MGEAGTQRVGSYCREPEMRGKEGARAVRRAGAEDI